MPHKLLMSTVHKQAFSARPAKWRQCLMCWQFPHVLPSVDSCMLYFIAFYYSACIAIDHQYCLATASKAVFSEHTCRTFLWSCIQCAEQDPPFARYSKTVTISNALHCLPLTIALTKGGLAVLPDSKVECLRTTLHIIVYVPLIANTITVAKSIYTHAHTHIFMENSHTCLILLLVLQEKIKNKTINTFSAMMSLLRWLCLTSKQRGTWLSYWTRCCATST